MPAEISCSWFGPLALAPAEVTTRFRGVPSFEALVARGWEPETTLLYAPPPDACETDGAVLGRMFAWDERSPVIWIFATVGLCRVDQAKHPGRHAFRHCELVMATNNAETEDPFPVRLGVVLSQGAGAFPAWDWDQ